MFEPVSAFSGFSVDDLDKAKEFYGRTLGLKMEDRVGGTRVLLPGDAQVWMYLKGKDHVPTTYTMLNFVVSDIDAAVDELAERGVRFERYEYGPPQDDKGILRGLGQGRGPDIAWFKDPAGNTLSVMQQS